jgi:hypothetical protein
MNIQLKGQKFKNTTDNEGESQTVLERIMALGL